MPLTDLKSAAIKDLNEYYNFTDSANSSNMFYLKEYCFKFSFQKTHLKILFQSIGHFAPALICLTLLGIDEVIGPCYMEILNPSNTGVHLKMLTGS